MDIILENRPSYAMAKVALKPGDSIRAESGAMVGMTPEINMETAARTKKGGIFKALGRMITGESFFLNTFSSVNVPGEVLLAPTNIGDLAVHQLDGDLYVTSSAFVASHTDVEIETKVAGFKSFFGGHGFFMMRATGKGPLILSSFGAMIEMDVVEPLVVDTGHIIAFEPTLNYSLKRVGSWYSTFFSGEGLVCHLTGRGKLWIQTRNPYEFGRSVGPMLPPRKG